ncbi:hypothetical protein FZEAL_8962 [Fusarium zealandicum]|uniref:Uncharacterized protein n=1 Tax=Fusarium zealandicum TaxID=1053134 RepID=A0A8H4UDA5_9HYPO|nr:hypothetical protein FZEAL_8962 [Fusarium zealandicum]
MASNIIDVAKDQAAGFISLARSTFDSVIPPQVRERALTGGSGFPHSKPVLADPIKFFIASQGLFALLPALFFVIFCLALFIFLIVAVVLFITFWVTFILLVLIPALLLGGSIAILVWAWGVGGWTIVGGLIRLCLGGARQGDGTQKEHEN